MIKCDKTNVILFDSMGIGNRIFTLFSCLRFFSTESFNLYWPTEGWVTDRFSNLFNFHWDYPILEIDGAVSRGDVSIPYPLDVSLSSLYVDKKEIFLNTPLKNIHTYRPFSMLLRYEGTPRRAIRLFESYFERLHPNPNVVKRVEEVDIPADFIFLQIRNNADWENERGGNRNIPLERYFELIDRSFSDRSIYLCAMNKGVSSAVRNRYGDRVFELPNKNYMSMIDAVADLYIGAKSTCFVVDGESTFSQLSWWLGGCRARVVLLHAKPNILKNIKRNIRRNHLLNWL